MNETRRAPGRPRSGCWIPKSHDPVPRVRWRNLANGEILSNRAGSGDLRRPDAKPALVDLQRADLRLESRSRDPEPCGRSRGPEHPAAAGPEGVLDYRPFLRGQGSGQPMSDIDLGPRGQP